MKKIYLTFDDGPGPYTKRLLDILDRYQVKATFFVTGRQKLDVISEIARRGHVIGNHTFSHKYKEIYSSEEVFFQELDRMNEIIREKTGQETKLLRFPGGSSNTVSCYNEKIMTRLVELVKKQGYTYFDWNVDSNDWKLRWRVWKIYRNIISGIKKHEEAVVLQHDLYRGSIEMVRFVIWWGKCHGYEFDVLSQDVIVHHKVNN